MARGEERLLWQGREPRSGINSHAALGWGIPPLPSLPPKSPLAPVFLKVRVARSFSFEASTLPLLWQGGALTVLFSLSL